MTLRLRRAAASAQDRPRMPAPTTARSNFFGEALTWIGRRTCVDEEGGHHCPPSILRQPPAFQNLYAIFTPTTLGRSGTSDLMNCADEVNTLAFEFERFVPNNSAVQVSLVTPSEAS